MSAKRWRPELRLLWAGTLILSAGALASFLTLPVLSLIATTFDDFAVGLRHPLVWPALELTLLTTSISLITIVVLGTPLAWLVSQATGRAVRVLETLLGLPIVIPPAVAGIALLLAFGRHGLMSGILYPEGTSLAFSTLAVVMAEVFVAAPFFLQAAISAFRSLDPELLVVARTLGAPPWRVVLRIALPLAAPGLIAGAAMSWARALGEFGATLMFAGNLPGRTTTLPLAVYSALETDLRAAQALSLVLVFVAFGLLIVIRASVSDRSQARARRGA